MVLVLFWLSEVRLVLLPMGPAFTGSGGTGTLGRGGMYEQSTHFIHRVVSTTETRSRAQGGRGLAGRSPWRHGPAGRLCGLARGARGADRRLATFPGEAAHLLTQQILAFLALGGHTGQQPFQPLEKNSIGPTGNERAGRASMQDSGSSEITPGHYR